MTIGVNVSGAEYSWMPFVGATDLDYLAGQGVTLIRLPISWERMQPTLNGSLDQTYLSGLENVLSEASARGMQVVIDLHNYGRYNLNYAEQAAANYGIVSSTTPDAAVIGSSAVPISAFANLWSQLSTQLKGHAGLAGYDIMNEPYNMGSDTVWPKAAQAAVDAIRATDTSTAIYVEGYQWASAANWTQYNANLHINDPASKIVYEAHAYFDSNGSGQYAQTYDQQGANSDVGIKDVKPFLDWLKANNYQGFLGEFGVPADDPKWIPVLNKVLDSLQDANVSGTYWNYVYSDPSGKNSWWPVADSMSINPKMGWGVAQMEAIFAHTTPTIIDFSPDSGTASDGITNSNDLIISGLAASQSTVHVFDGRNEIGVVKAALDGTWSFKTGVLADAAHSFTATQQDAAGTVSKASTAVVVTVDTVAPNAPKVASFGPDSDATRGGVTNTNHVTLTGTAEANSKVHIFDGSTEIGIAKADANGAWSFATKILADGVHNVTSDAVDAAGNVSDVSSTLKITVDTVVPNAPNIASFSSNSKVADSGITNVNHVILVGTGEANSTLHIYDGTTEIGLAKADAGGIWSLSTGTLADGVHSFTGKAADAAGNVSTLSSALKVTVDTVAPDVPKVTSFSPDSNVANDGVTNDSHVTLNGAAEAGANVRVFEGMTELGTTTANASGFWTFSTGLLADGEHSFTSKAADAAGNVSGTSSALKMMVDTVAPNAPPIASVSSDGNLASYNIINASYVTLAGVAEDGSTVHLFDGMIEIGTAKSGPDGIWSFATSALADGIHSFTSKAVDAAGNVSGASAALDATINSAGLNTPSTVTVYHTDSSGKMSSFDTTSIEGNSIKVIHFDGGGKTLGAEVSTVDGNSTTTMYFDGSWQQTKVDIATVNGNSTQTIHLDANWKIVGAEIATIEGHNTTTMHFNSDWQQISVDIVTLNPDNTMAVHLDANWSVVGADVLESDAQFATITHFDSNWHQTAVDKSSVVALSVNDILTGGAQNDIFVFKGIFGNDVVTNFQSEGAGHDVLQFEHSAFNDFSAILASAVQIGHDVLISGDAGSVTLEATNVKNLHAYDFHFV